MLPTFFTNWFWFLFGFLVISVILAPEPLSASVEPFHYHCIEQSGKISQCLGNRKPAHFEHHNKNLVAYSKYSNRINETGWAELELETNGALKDEEQAYFAGVLEGYVTAELITNHRINLLDNDKDGTKYCKPYQQFIQTNLNTTLGRIRFNPNDRYWQQVLAILYQISGLETGYNRFYGKSSDLNNPHLKIEPCGIFLMNIYAELSGIGEIIKVNSDPNFKVLDPLDRCSALVKVLPDAEDVLVAHNTWTSLNTMTRIMKRITLNLKHSVAKTVIMSSYPGLVYSLDDFYTTDQRMVIQETTNSNFNERLYNGLDAKNIVPEFIRTMTSNRLASNGSEWARVFTKHNSGTYNNQFMIVDYKKFPEPGNIQWGLLTILEQLPNNMFWGDMTSMLMDQLYWPSFNVPFFKETYQLSHYPQHYREVPIDLYRYDENPRARIFARDHGNVTDLKSLFTLMRYNNFRHDPLSHCNCTPPYTAEYAIASRNDLNDPSGKYPDFHLALRPSAAIDAKMVNSKLVHRMEVLAVSGPTDQNVEPFVWSTSRVNKAVYHLGQPDRWQFKPILASWHNHTGVFQEYHF